MNKISFLAAVIALFIVPTSGCFAQSSTSPTLAKQLTISPNGVNLQTGRLFISETDFSIGDLNLTRAWGNPDAFVTGVRAFGLVAGGRRNFHGWNLALYAGVIPNGSGPIRHYQAVTESDNYTFSDLTESSGFRPVGSSSAGAKLTLVNGNFELIDRSGGRHYYLPHVALNPQGSATPLAQLLMQSVKPDGTVVDYQYNASAQLIFVSSSRGYAIRIEYDNVGNVSQACGFNRTQIISNSSTTCTLSTLRSFYGYAGGSYLRSVTGPSGEVTSINYGPNPDYGPTCITLADSSVCRISNEFKANSPTEFAGVIPQAVIRQIRADGATWTYNYEPLPVSTVDEPIVPGRPRRHETVMVAPDGEYRLTYDRGNLTAMSSPAGLTTYNYTNESYIQPLGFTYETFEFLESKPKLINNLSGTKEYFLYNERGQLIIRSLWPIGSPPPTLVSGSLALSSDPTLASCCIKDGVLTIPAGSVTVSQAFPISVYTASWPTGCGSGDASAKLCNNPIATIDARGNQTDYTYDPAHGGVLTETGPAQPNNVRPQTRYTYIQKQARIKDASGNAVATGLPVWLLASKSYCKTSAASGAGCAVAGDQVTTTYDYGPDTGFNNLLLRGMVDDSTGAALRTCYSYDWQGNRISETRPMAGLSACP